MLPGIGEKNKTMKATDNYYFHFETKEQFRMFHDSWFNQNILISEITGEVIEKFSISEFPSMTYLKENNQILWLDENEFWQL